MDKTTYRLKKLETVLQARKHGLFKKQPAATRAGEHDDPEPRGVVQVGEVPSMPTFIHTTSRAAATTQAYPFMHALWRWKASTARLSSTRRTGCR